MDKSISLTLPLFEKGSSIAAFRLKYEGYCLLLKLDENEQVKLLPMCFPHQKFDSIWESFDDRTTLKTAFEKIDAFLKQEDRPVDPLNYFTSCFWQSNQTIYEYIRELRSRAGFVTQHKKAIDDLLRLQVVRSLPTGLASLVSTMDKVDELSSFLASVPRPREEVTRPVFAAQSSNVTCYNCDRRGHYSRQCTSSKVRCRACQKFGHLAKHCRTTKKSMAMVTDELDQST